MTTKKYFVYISTNNSKTTLYIGVTNNISNRFQYHAAERIGLRKSFAGKYNCINVIYYEEFKMPMDAIRREKQLKGWSRAKKEAIINGMNPEWKRLV